MLALLSSEDVMGLCRCDFQGRWRGDGYMVGGEGVTAWKGNGMV
jgi:hypothetical protein